MRLEAFLHFLVLLTVIVPYWYLFYAAMKVPDGDFRRLFPRVFKKNVYPRFECPAVLTHGYFARFERNSYCQLDFEAFSNLCNVFTFDLTLSEKKLLFKTLDVSGDKYLSWGEVSVDYFNTTYGALEYYIQRWRKIKDVDTERGLGRVSWFPYSRFAFYERIEENQWW